MLLPADVSKPHNGLSLRRNTRALWLICMAVDVLLVCGAFLVIYTPAVSAHDCSLWDTALVEVKHIRVGGTLTLKTTQVWFF